MRESNWLSVCLSAAIPAVLFGAVSLAPTGAMAADCVFATPLTTQTKCLKAIIIPGNPLRSFDISFVNPDRDEYYFADRSNASVDVIDTEHLKFKRFLGGFTGVAINPKTGAVDNNHSGPDGVATHGKWLYAGDGNSTLKVIDLNAGTIVQSVPTGGSTRVDEMALTGPNFFMGQLLLAANNAEDPPFATLFQVNGNNFTNNIKILARINVDPSILPPGQGLSLEQPAWDPVTKRFYVSVPNINYPTGCTQNPAAVTGTNISSAPAGAVICQGGLLVIDPSGVTAPNCTMISGIPALGSVCQYTEGGYNRTNNVGVLALATCNPNGAFVGPRTDMIGNNLLLGCTVGNNANNASQLAINTVTTNFANVGNITGSDEVWYNPGDGHYYTGSSANIAQFGGPTLGIIDAFANILVSQIPQGSGSHSVAADSIRNTIFVPQVVPRNASNVAQPGAGGGDNTGVSKQTCGGNNGCIVVYQFVPPPPPPIVD